MPRYFFHVRHGEESPDLEGMELPDLGAARFEAVRFLSGLLADNPNSFWDAGALTLRAADDTGLTLFELNLFATSSPATYGTA